MNIKELNESVKNNQKIALEETIKEIERKIIWCANNCLNNFKADTSDNDYYYTIRKWMVEPLKEYFENEGYKVEVEEIKDPIKWFDKLLDIYEPEYLMIISWEEV